MRVNAASGVKSAAAGLGCQGWQRLARGHRPLAAGWHQRPQGGGAAKRHGSAGAAGVSRARVFSFQVKLQKSLEHLSKEVEDVKKRESVERMKTQECKAGAWLNSYSMSFRAISNYGLVWGREFGIVLRTGPIPMPHCCTGDWCWKAGPVTVRSSVKKKT